MKLHWGNAIFLFFVAYIGFLGFTLYQSTQVDHSLVVEDYYAQDLAYQEKYEKLANYAESATPLTLAYDADQRRIDIVSPPGDQSMEGTITFYHPSKSTEDIKMDFSVRGGDQASFSLAELSGGRWIAQIDYVGPEKKYYFEKDIFIR